VSYFSGLKENIIIGGVFLCLPILLSLLAYKFGYWLHLVAQESAVMISISLAFRTNYATEGRQKRFIKNAFKQYLSPTVIDQLLQNPERLKLGGERKIISIFFSDLQGFTTISEGLDPETLTNLLNDYLSEMTEIIQAEGGTVDKYEGDAIIAFWNAPLEVPDHAIKVVRAALNCQAKLAELRPVFKKQIDKDMYMRIGINTGPAVVGNMGSRTRFDYTMMGDAVNLASRLEELNKRFGTYTMVSEYTSQLTAGTFAFRELGRIVVFGRSKPVTVYEPMFKDDYRSRRDVLVKFEKALNHFYRRQFQQAQEIFLSIQEEDPPATAYVKRCLEVMTDKPANRTGTWVMRKK
jgi:adenylate cyclase